MKRSLAMVAGIGATLLMAGRSEAAYTGITWEQDLFALDGVTTLASLGMPGNFKVYNIYATTSLANDQIIGVIGSPEFPFSVFVQGGQNTAFHNDPAGDAFGGPSAQLFVNLVPSLNWDSFFTIGARTDEEFGVSQPGNVPIALQIPPGVPAPASQGKWGGGQIGMNMAWVLPPTIGTPPLPPPSSIAGPDLRVLIMRLTVQDQSKIIQGSFGVLSVTGGVPQDPEAGSFKTVLLPAPGAMALLGLAGLAGFSRRRRG